MSFSKEIKDKVWNKANKVFGKDPTQYRKDPYRNTIYYNSYGMDSAMGWEIDHIKPKAKGGSDAIRNLQALQTKINRNKKADLRKKSRHSKSNK